MNKDKIFELLSATYINAILLIVVGLVILIICVLAFYDMYTSGNITSYSYVFIIIALIISMLPAFSGGYIMKNTKIALHYLKNNNVVPQQCKWIERAQLTDEFKIMKVIPYHVDMKLTSGINDEAYAFIYAYYFDVKDMALKVYFTHAIPIKESEFDDFENKALSLKSLGIYMQGDNDKKCYSLDIDI